MEIAKILQQICCYTVIYIYQVRSEASTHVMQRPRVCIYIYEYVTATGGYKRIEYLQNTSQGQQCTMM